MIHVFEERLLSFRIFNLPNDRPQQRKVNMHRTGLAAMLLATSYAVAAPCDLVLNNANVWIGSEYKKQSIKIEDGKFVLSSPATDGVDASFLYLSPPFVDAHTHAIDEPASTSDARHKTALSQGVFYALNPNNIRTSGQTPPAQTGLVELQAAGGGITRTGGHPQPLYTVLASRGFVGSLKVEDLPGRAFHLADQPEQARAAVRAVHANGAEFVKLYLLNHTHAKSAGLSGESFNAAVDEAKKLKLRPLAHIENAKDFRRAVKAGVFGIVHLPYAAPSTDFPLRSYLLTSADAVAAAKSGVIVVPTATAGAMSHNATKLAQVQVIQRHNMALLKSAGVRMAVGADTYSLSMHDEITTLRSFAMFSGAEIIRMATLNGAQLVFPARKLGQIASGYEASFVAYFYPLTSNWAGQREPAIGMRAGEVMLDTIGFFKKACQSAE